MKSKAKSKIIILITLEILFAFLPIITTNLSIISDNSNKSSDYSDDSNLENKNLIFKSTTLIPAMHIYLIVEIYSSLLY